MRMTLLLLSLGLFFSSCRTTQDAEAKLEEKGLPDKATPSQGKIPLLKKVIGGITTQYPENREAECLVFQDDIADIASVVADLEAIKAQDIREGFIFRPQIPSIQYFGVLGGESFLLQEIGAEKAKFRMPADAENPGNPQLDKVVKLIQEFCKDVQ